MASRRTDRVVKKGWFLYGGSARCNIEIVQTDFRPGCADDEAPVEDAYGEFYEIRYFWPGRTPQAGGGWHDNLSEAMCAVEAQAKVVNWEDA